MLENDPKVSGRLGKLYKLSYIRRPELHELGVFTMSMGRRIYTLQESTEPGQTLGGKAPGKPCCAWHYYNPFHKHVPYQARCCTLEERRRSTPSPLLLLVISPLSKCLLIKKALKITWENILWFLLSHYMAARMLWNSPQPRTLARAHGGVTGENGRCL